MPTPFTPVALEHASRLLNHGPTVLVTSAHGDRRNVMAAAWSMPVEFSPPRIAIVIDKNTFTRELIAASGAFGVCIPGAALADLTFAVGSCSGRDGDKFARFTPYDGFRLGFTVEFNHPAIPASRSRAVVEFSTENYIKEVSRARTFGFMHDLEFMRERNLGLGGSMDNAIVLDEFRVLNDDGLRYADEFVRHKILDAVGDLYLAGGPILGAYEGFKSGHALNNKLVRALLAERSSWDEVVFESHEPVPVVFGVPQLA